MTPIFFCGSCYNIQFKPYATSNMELFVTKKGNSWKLLLTFVTLSFILNVTGLLDTTLKCIDKVIKIYIKAVSIPSAIYLLKVRKKILVQSVKYIQTWRLVLLLLTLKMFHTLWILPNSTNKCRLGLIIGSFWQ